MLEFHAPLPAATVARVRDNWQSLQADVAAAAQRADRQPDSIRVVGVTKYVDPETAACLPAAGCLDLGENRPQMLWEKHAWLQEHAIDAAPVRWHLIGHLQRNKLRRTVPCLELLHSVDSLRLATSLGEQTAGKALRRIPLPVLLEINISGEDAKTGLTPQEARDVLEATLSYDGIQVIGLMGMAGFSSSPKQAQAEFAQLRCWRDAWQSEFGLSLPELSMGMSGDFEAAIAEGATLLRIGSRLFEGIERRPA